MSYDSEINKWIILRLKNLKTTTNLTFIFTHNEKNRPELKNLERIYLVQDKIKFYLKKKKKTHTLCVSQSHLSTTAEAGSL